MKTRLHNDNYDTKLEASDWRFSAAICGLMQYFDFYAIDYKIDEDFIVYNSEDITEERYLLFVEDKYRDQLHHTVIESLLKNEELSDVQIKLVNDKLSANSIMKNVFEKIKYSPENRVEILDRILSSRLELIRETYGKMDSGLYNYCNVDRKSKVGILKDTNKICRLNGYYVDLGRKTKSASYKFNNNSFVMNDELEFDFIPFGFNGDKESFFINDNYSIEKIRHSNRLFREKLLEDIDDGNKKKDSRKVLFKAIIEGSDLISRDVEIIHKNSDRNYFETMYIRKESIEILKSFKTFNIKYEDFCTYKKITEKYYLNIQSEVINCILNNIVLDDLIEKYLKEKNGSYMVSQLIKVDLLIRRDSLMKDKLKGAYACAKKVSQGLEENKLNSYKQKLTSSIIFKDYDRVCQILLQLSNYSGIEFGFVYDLYDDFEENKDLAYTFINALSKSDQNSKVGVERNE